jgi:peptidoglycan hydrolase CwlO-like protein
MLNRKDRKLLIDELSYEINQRDEKIKSLQSRLATLEHRIAANGERLKT